MMKYKVLLTGTNRTVIDDFFTNMDSFFECFCTSLRYDDIMNHIKYIKPDVIIYCLNSETRENISQFVAIKHNTHGEVPLIIIGAPDECDEFSRISINTVNLSLVKPVTASTVKERVAKFLDERKRAEEEAVARIKTEAVAKAADEKRRILVIDDDIRMLKMIKEQLHDRYDVATATNGKLAFKFLENKNVDLILLDYQMPDENGPEVLEKLRARNDLADIPVLFLTGVTEREKIQNALSLKPQGYLLKPIDRDKLLDAIRSFVK